MALGSKLAKFMALGLKLIALGSKLEMGATGAIGASAYLGQVCKNCKNCNKWSCKNTFDTWIPKQTAPRNIEPHDSIKDALQSAAREIRHWQLAGKALATLPAPGSSIPTREENTITLQVTWWKHVDTLQLVKVEITHIRSESSLFKKQLWCFKRLSTDKQATKPNLLSWTYSYQYEDASLQTFLYANQLPSDAPEVKCSKDFIPSILRTPSIISQ